MNDPCNAVEKRSLEEVRRRFEHWRAERKRGTRIPASLWEEAVRLCADHPLYAVSRTLHLDYVGLKRHLGASRPDPPAGSLYAADFVALDLRASAAGGACVLEMERHGARMRLHFRGELGPYSLELVRAAL
jgi:hypothetical protein